MIWWHWVLLGLLLLGIEMVTPGGFYILFFGLAALIVGGLTGIGFAQDEWLQWLMFSGLAILSLLAFRSSLLTWMNRRNANRQPRSKTSPPAAQARRNYAAPSGLPTMPASLRC
jgi:membrane protein implicated in regulation of membrane protease activity